MPSRLLANVHARCAHSDKNGNACRARVHWEDLVPEAPDFRYAAKGFCQILDLSPGDHIDRGCDMVGDFSSEEARDRL